MVSIVSYSLLRDYEPSDGTFSSTSRDSDSWTTNGHTVSTLQEFVKKFQKTHLVSGKKEKMTLSADADTGIVTVIDPDDYNEDEYEDYYDEDNEGEYENE